MSQFDSPEKDHHNSTHALGHHGMVEVFSKNILEFNTRGRQRSSIIS
jgi:hypothetical protein